ncbi:MAG: multicopper oxidase domain-containing protein [Acidaminobacter sp.]|uniref:multicopper oxidase family protein n=1 Tax=Acidaminobacter sp. TaxID=1872102 RepID=UPI0013820573|nr:multicopper oxidase domain-containing protein [Acidaminobacter sp.]MZQ99672.1 multicopper oxidase domain-containing protein [Acidaminobacter sp.]
MRKKLKGSDVVLFSMVAVILILGAVLIMTMPKALLNEDNSVVAGPKPEGNPLKLPALLEDLDPDPLAARYELTAARGETQFTGSGSAQTMGYNGTYLGPILRMRNGERVEIRVINALDAATTVHWHGLIVDGEQDGGPHQVILPGDSWTPEFVVEQPSATLWYHPHLQGETANQVYFGLAGLIYIEDDQASALPLPKIYGVDDFPLIVQDRSFNADGGFNYQTTMMGVVPGDQLMVNGTLAPYLEVPRGLVRFRLLNASNAVNFDFTLSDGSDLTQIASDGGLLEAPVVRRNIELAPGERAEVIVDFSSGKEQSVDLMANSAPLLEFRVQNESAAQTTLPSTLSYLLPGTFDNVSDLPVREFYLESMGISGTINGKTYDLHRIDEVVSLNTPEVWVVRNTGGMMMPTGGHPFHIHSTQFRVISRNGETPPPWEQGFKDTVFVRDGEEVRLLVNFARPGVFMYHCHILEHEDNGMMGQFRVE